MAGLGVVVMVVVVVVVGTNVTVVRVLLVWLWDTGLRRVYGLTQGRRKQIECGPANH